MSILRIACVTNRLLLHKDLRHYDTLRYATLHYATLRYATLRYATLRYATLRYLVYLLFALRNASVYVLDFPCSSCERPPPVLPP